MIYLYPLGFMQVWFEMHQDGFPFFQGTGCHRLEPRLRLTIFPRRPFRPPAGPGLGTKLGPVVDLPAGEVQTNIELGVSQTVRVDATLQIGATSETVSVTADSDVLQKDTASVGQTL